MQGTKLESLSYCEWECMFREWLLCDLMGSYKPEQRMNIEVCGSGLFIKLWMIVCATGEPQVPMCKDRR